MSSKEIAQMQHVSTDKLVHDLRAVVNDTEELLRATAGNANEKIAQARARAEESLRGARERLHNAEHEVVERARAAARETDAYVHEHPWNSIGVAAGVAFLVGLLLGRR
jgi:ElaB/YqjD/DUF883 family membrane-anchored ribosome-binding protein